MSGVQDLRFAFRMLRKKPWFSAAIVVTLGFGMGINTTVFSLVYAVLFKPLPFPGGERLVIAIASRGRETHAVSYADYLAFRKASTSFERLEAISRMAVDLGERDIPPQRYRGGRITPGMFDMLGMRPVAGRGFESADAKPGAQTVVLLGYGVWKDRYSNDPAVIGRTVRVNEAPAVIVGVMPEGFKFPNSEDLWTCATPPDAAAAQRRDRDYRMIGMLTPGVSIDTARADLGVIANHLAAEYPATNKNFGAAVQTFHESMNGGEVRVIFLLMMGAVGFVLLIACANVANMLLSRAVERSREVSIRAAMGASRWRLVRQLLVESVVLAAVGGGMGLLLSAAGIAAFDRATADVGKPYWIDFSMNYVGFGYFAALTIVTGVIFGLAPALSASRVNLNDTLKEGARSSGGRLGGWLSGALVVLQFSLAVVLLSGAGLMMRSFLVATNEFSEMRAGSVLTARISLPRERYPKPEDRQRFFEQLAPRLASLPGVQSAAMTSNAPGEGSATWRFEVEGAPPVEAAQRPTAFGIVSGKGYLPLLGVSLLRGRDFEDIDGLPGREAAIIGQSLAARHFPNQDPIGRRIRLFDGENRPKPWMTIVGVTPEIRQQPPNESGNPLVILPYRFESYSGMTLVLRTAGAPTALAAGVRSEVQGIDQDLPLFDTMSLAQQFYRRSWYLSVFGTVFLIFAIVAMAMAAVGIYAVMAHAAGRRTREIGVRMALGAGERSILAMMLARGLTQLGLGMVLGLAAALAVCRLMARLLFGVSPSDPLTFAIVTLALGIAGLAAIFFPARRAARLDPLQALRYE